MLFLLSRLRLLLLPLLLLPLLPRPRPLLHLLLLLDFLNYEF